LVCEAPRGYFVADRSKGPGAVITMLEYAHSASRSTVSLRLYPIGDDDLEWFLRERIIGPLERSDGVKLLAIRPGRRAGHKGFDAELRWNTYQGKKLQRIFAFHRGGDAWLAETMSAEGTPSAVLDAFLSSFKFESTP